MVRHQARLLVLAQIILDVTATAAAWLLAYHLRFHSGAVHDYLPVTKGVPALSRYLLLLPLMAVLWPTVLYFHGLYRLGRGRSRIDEFFATLVSVLIASALTLGATLYVRVYYRYQPEVAPLWEYSQGVFAIFLVLDVLLITLLRSALRHWLQRMWAAGKNVRRVLVAGAGDLGQKVAETLATHRELGFRVHGFVDDSPSLTPPPAPVLGHLDQVTEIVASEAIDQLWIALPLEEHAKLPQLLRSVRNECLDIKVVPDLVQYATIRAALDDIDGIPVISLSEVPLRGWSSMVKRAMDFALGTVLLALLTFVVPLFPVIAFLIKWKGGKGPVFHRQERMTLDGKTFQIFKFRTMIDEAEKHTGPVWAAPDDPRRTRLGIWLRKYNLDEFPQLINVVLGDMSLVGPRPERPPFVAQFKERIPQYMLRHRVRSGITGWAQVNGWRGNTSIEKRIEYDLYYIENWSLLLDLKILILTLLRGFGQKHAY
jgi:Undecaprenyl-phosphate glucose phosphotransferase